MNLAIIMACHNRASLTNSAINQAQRAADAAGVLASFTVFDDGSTDGTQLMLHELSASLNRPSVTTIQGDGTAFWARGMAIAERDVLTKAEPSDPTHIVWLNDDVVLDEDAFVRLHQSVEQFPESVIVGAMRDSAQGGVSYSGMRRSGLHPLSFRKVDPNEQHQRVSTFNGNLVLVPIATAQNLGGIDGEFSHGLADIDYGLRCGRTGVGVILAPGTFGLCSGNPLPVQQPVWTEWRSFTGRKGGGNLKSLRRILQRSHGRFWWIPVAATYGLWWVRKLVPRQHRAMSLK